MWLPKDERQILRMLYKKSPEPSQEMHFGETGLVDLINPDIAEEDKNSTSAFRQKIERIGPIIDNMKMAEKACIRLKERGLVQFEKYLTSDCYTECRLTLNLEGWDLGRKYSNCLDTSHIWWSEYKNHPVIWVLSCILSFIAGYLLKK